MNKIMTWIRKYILNRKVSYALCLYAVVLFFLIVLDYPKDIVMAFPAFILPPLYYLAYIHFLNRTKGIWLTCSKAILLLGALGLWIFLIYGLFEYGLPSKSELLWASFLLIYFVLFPFVFLGALFEKFNFRAFLKFFLKKIVWVPIASIVSFAVVWTLIVMVSIGGLQNFKERIGFELHILYENYSQHRYSTLDKYEVCTDIGIPLANFGEFNEFYLKERIQFWNYFDVPQREALDRNDPKVLEESRKKAKSFLPFYKGDPKAQIQQAYYLSFDRTNYTYNFCEEIRWLLRAAHQGDGVAKGLLMHWPTYSENIMEMDLSNPVLAYIAANFLDSRIDWPPYTETNSAHNFEYDLKALKYLEKSADAGYIPAMNDLSNVYSNEIYFNKENCSKKIKIHEDLASQKSLIDNWNLMHAYMGKISHLPARQIYRCLDETPNFAKAFSLLSNMKSYSKDMFNRRFREALFYLNGWSVQQDYLKSHKLFNECYDKRGSSLGLTSCISYLSYMTLKGLGTAQDTELGREIFLTKLGTEPTTNNNGISCGGETIEYIRVVSSSIDDPVLSEEDQKKIDSEKAKEREKMNAIYARVVQCIKDADRETLLAIVEAHIRNQLSEFYKNEELLATLNVMGEPQ